MKLFVWGIGGGTARIIDKWIKLSDIDAFIVSNKTDNVFLEYMNRPVYSPEEIVDKAYDAIIVGSVYVENIFKECKKYGLDLNKVVFLYRAGAAVDRTINQELMYKILGKDITALIQNSWRVIDSSVIADYDNPQKYNYRNMGIYANDFVRLRTFELLVREINDRNIMGSVAELGVFRGEFTYFLNREFPDRKCYLFDTFEGFEESEIKKEIGEGNANEAIVEAYTNTSIDIVKSKLENQSCVDIRKGYFPESLNGLEDRFAFVSIDVDFEESIYNGLVYFYPRLNEGGYIMIHDYNSFMHGVKKAVRRYETEIGNVLRMVPLADCAGTVVIVK